jgi:hypothetical protein
MNHKPEKYTMRQGIRKWLFAMVVLGGCSGSSDQRSDKSDTTKPAKVNNSVPPGAIATDSASFKEYDVYQFKNDSLIQTAYVHYLTPTKIVFRLTSVNRKNGKSCDLMDTARITSSDAVPDPAAYADELNGDDMYPAYEYLYDRRDSFHTFVGIEPERGNRLKVQTALDSLCGYSTPFTSAGTLRRIRLSPVKQKGPSLPAVPK